MKLILLAAVLCLCATLATAQTEFRVTNALIYDDAFVQGALWVNIIYDDYMPTTTNPVRTAGSGTMVVEYLNDVDEVIMEEVHDFFFKYVFQYCDDCTASTVQQQMPIYYHDPTYYTQAIGSEVVNGVTCQGYENPAVAAGTPTVSRRIYVDESASPVRPCRHEWSTGKKIDFLTTSPTNSLTVYPDGSNSIDDDSISVLDGQNVLPAASSFPWASGCPAPTCKVKIDLIIVMDESGSIQAPDYEKEKGFVSDMVDAFTISPDDVRAAVVKFGWDSVLAIPLLDSKPVLLNLINDLTQAGGATCIGCGISTGLLEIQRNGRSDASCVMLVLTDGFNNQQKEAFPGVVANAKAHPCEIFGIGVEVEGQLLDETLNEFVSEPIADHKFLVDDFNGLATVLNSVVTATCQEIPGSLCGAGCQGLCLCQTTCECPSSCEDFNECTTETCVRSGGFGCTYRGVDCLVQDQGAGAVDFCKIYTCDEDTGCSSVDVDCDDMDPCTVDICLPASGCSRTALDCTNDNPCTVDTCNSSVPLGQDPCVNTLGNCFKCQDQLNDTLFVDCSIERFNPNFADVSPCNPAICNINSPNEPYDVASGLTVGDGPCEFRPVDCDDDNACTNTVCNAADGVCTVVSLVECDDGNACTIDTCDPNAAAGVDPCVFTPVNATLDCFDGNPCTQDLCLPESGCDNSQEVDCSSLSECEITSCQANRGGCVVERPNCVPDSACFAVECVPENQGGEFDPLVHCIQTEIEGTINSCGECLGNDVACQLEGSKATTIALTVGVIAAIVIAVIIALALGAFASKKGYDHWKNRNNAPPSWSAKSAIHKDLPSGSNAAAQ